MHLLGGSGSEAMPCSGRWRRRLSVVPHSLDTQALLLLALDVSRSWCSHCGRSRSDAATGPRGSWAQHTHAFPIFGTCEPFQKVAESRLPQPRWCSGSRSVGVSRRVLLVRSLRPHCAQISLCRPFRFLAVAASVLEARHVEVSVSPFVFCSLRSRENSL